MAGAGGLVLFGAVGSVVAGDAPALPVLLPVIAAVATLAVVAWWWPGVRYHHWTYLLGDDALEVSYGPVVRTESVIPYFRVQHVDTSAGPIERRLGLVKLAVHTASAATDATLPGLAVADAEAIRRRMLERAGSDDAV